MSGPKCNSVTFKWIAGVVIGLGNLAGGWFVASHVRANARDSEKVTTNQVEIGVLTTKTDMLVQQFLVHQSRQDEWNRRIDGKIDELLKRRP